MVSAERELGEFGARLDAMEARQNSMDETIKSIDQKLTIVRDTMLRAEGSWKALVGIAMASAAVGAGLAKIADWIGIFTWHH
jgi:hypothetical protein